MKPKAYIFDVDGTIADGNHRQHYVRTKPKNWAAYNAGMHNDLPIDPVIETLKRLADNADIVICSGREEVYMKQTVAWLDKHRIPYHHIFMRNEKDYRDDTVVKKEMYEEIKELYDVIAVFDDRPKVCRMWVDEGVFVFRCQQVEEEF